MGRTTGEIVCRERLGGMLKYYYSEACLTSLYRHITPACRERTIVVSGLIPVHRRNEQRGIAFPLRGHRKSAEKVARSNSNHQTDAQLTVLGVISPYWMRAKTTITLGLNACFARPWLRITGRRGAGLPQPDAQASVPNAEDHARLDEESIRTTSVVTDKTYNGREQEHDGNPSRDPASDPRHGTEKDHAARSRQRSR